MLHYNYINLSIICYPFNLHFVIHHYYIRLAALCILPPPKLIISIRNVLLQYMAETHTFLGATVSPLHVS